MGESNRECDDPYAGIGAHHADNFYSHVRLQNDIDDLDHLDRARDSAAFLVKVTESVLDRTGPDLDRSGADVIARIVAAYAGFWPLKLSTLCRALIADQHPLASTRVRKFIAHLDKITPEFQVIVRWAARQALKAGLISRRSVDLRGRQHDNLF